MYKRLFKRLIDIVLSAMAIAVLAIPMMILAVVVKLDSPGPVLFWQKRIGIHKSTFLMPKLRTMYATAPANMPTHLLNNPEAYITRSGKWLRKYSLDELPQIWSIFTSRMSIIGPRPALWNQYDLIAERDKYGANDVKPGLTGWAQVNGRDELKIEDKARLDGIYTENISLKMDWICFIATVGKVLKHSGVIEGGTGIVAKHMEKREIETENEQGVEANQSEAVR